MTQPAAIPLSATAHAIEARVRIETLGVITRDRPESLGRVLTSAHLHARAHGRRPQTIVIDTGESEQTAAMLAALDDLGRIHHVDRATLARYATRLAQATGVSRRSIERAILGPASPAFGAGASRNALLLATAGTAALGVDDDMVFQLAASPGGDSRARVHFGAGEPTRMWSFGSQRECQLAVRRVDADLYAAHEQLLGRVLGDCGDARDSESLVASFGDELARGAGRVRITLTGVAGDCGLSSPLPNLIKDGPSLEHVLADYERRRFARQVLRVSEVPYVTRRAFCMTGCFAFDHRTTLPPFAPLGRGEDGLFANILRRVDRDGFIGHVPLAMLHEPQDVRAFDERSMFRGLRFTDCLVLLTLSLGFDERLEPAARMRVIGRCFQELGSQPREELVEMLRVAVARHLSYHLAYCERLIRSRPDAPQAWRADIERHVDHQLALLRDPSQLAPCDLDVAGDPWATFGARLADYGELLAAWPTLVDAALRERLVDDE